MLSNKAIAQRTNSGGMIICEYLQVPGSTTARVQDGDGRDKRWVKRTLSSYLRDIYYRLTHLKISLGQVATRGKFHSHSN